MLTRSDVTGMSSSERLCNSARHFQPASFEVM
jgi:hypothetical protein